MGNRDLAYGLTHLALDFSAALVDLRLQTERPCDLVNGLSRLPLPEIGVCQ